ncbi:MAG: 7-carboxy-7-deazaguanine synthase QueE [Saprospiraceae bacterium]|nr:7-carboxy-7-deazaguanine synthase QueE [Saprospiraceae bacterium]
MKRLNKLAVSEYFYSLQGEGRTMGIPAIFLRLTGCNLMCGGYGVEKDGRLRDGATWVCDTIEVWMKGTTFSFEDLVQTLNKELDFINRLNQGVHLVITGGEPLLQEKRIVAFLDYLETQHHCCPTIEVETNATFLPSAAFDQRVSYWNTSPKLQNSGMPRHQRIKAGVLTWFAKTPKTMFKFVIGSIQDWEEIQEDFLNEQLIPKSQIVLMPSADSIDSLLKMNRLVADICIENQVRMCTRMHIEIWDQLTGV